MSGTVPVSARYSLSALTPPSSNPADIYRDLKRDIGAGDMHSPKIREQKAVFLKLADEWHNRACSAAGRLVLNVLGSVSQWEREAIGERTALAAFEEARMLSCGGCVAD